MTSNTRADRGGYDCWRPYLRRETGVTTTEVLVISGLIVSIIIGTMFVFRGKMTEAVTNLGNCIAQAAAGDFSGCRGGGAGGPRRAAADPNKIPGMRDGGVAGGLVMADGKPRPPGGKVGPLNANLNDPRLADAHTLLTRFNNRWNSNKPDDPSWQERGVRLWNATSLFSSNRSLNSSQDALNDMADRSHGRAQQWAQLAEQRLNAGDLRGFQDAMNNARRFENVSNRTRGNAASIMADAADQAMSEAADIRQISFETASAIGNPTGYVTGKVTGYVVSTAADQILPDGRLKNVIVAVSSAAAAAYAGGVTPQAWQNLGAAGQSATNILGTGLSASGQAVSNAIGIADSITSVTTTASTQGMEEAGWEVATNLIVHGVMNTKSTKLADADGNARSLNDYISQAPSAAAIKEGLENNLVPLGQLEVNAQNLQNLGDNAYNKARGNFKEDPLTGKTKIDPTTGEPYKPKDIQYKPLDADPAYVAAFKNHPDPTEATHPGLTQAIKDGATMGQTPEMVIAKIKHAEITGGTFFDRATQLEATQLIRDGKAVGKTTDQHQKSAGDKAPYLPMDTMESKVGDQVRNAKTPKEHADAAEAVKNNDHAINDATAKGKVSVGPPPPGDTRIKGPIARDPQTGLPFVGDVDPVTNNLSRPTDPVRDGGVRGLGTTKELQDVSNLKGSLKPHNLDSTANHGHGGRNPGKEPLPDRVIRTTPDGKVQIIEGRVNVLNAIRQAGCPEHPSWAKQAQDAAAASPTGPKLVARPPNPPTPFNQKPTVGQAALANNRNTIRTNYVRSMQRWKPTPDKKDKRDGVATVPVPSTGRRPRGVPDPDHPLRPAPDIGVDSEAWSQPRFGILRVRAATSPQPPVPPVAPTPESADVDWSANRTWGMGINQALDEYGETWNEKQILIHLKAYQRIRAYALAEFEDKERIDIYVRWAFGLLRGGPYPLPSSNQSAVFERIDAQAAPAWRSDLDARVERGLHAGLAQHYTQQAMALGRQQPYAVYEAQTTIAQSFIGAVDEAVVRRAFFMGDTWGMYRRIGLAIGATGTEAAAAGSAFVRQIDNAAVAGNVALAQQLLGRMARPGAKPVHQAGTRIPVRARAS